MLRFHCVEQQTSINLCIVMIVKIFLNEPWKKFRDASLYVWFSQVVTSEIRAC